MSIVIVAILYGIFCALLGALSALLVETEGSVHSHTMADDTRPPEMASKVVIHG